MAFSDEASILQAAVEQSDYAVILTTAELESPGPTIVYVNEAVTRMTGYPREELVGATPRMFQGPATDRTELDRLKANLRAGHALQQHTWNYRKDGTPYQVEWTVTPLRSEGGRIDYFFSVQRDVTEQYQVEEKLASETRRVSALLHSAGSADDPVTGALNHRGMLLQIQRLVDDAPTPDSVVGLVSLHFKRLDRVDQAFGVDAINQLLSDIGERLGHRLESRESLARSHEHIFAVLTPVATEVADDADHQLMARARALVAAIVEQDFDVGGDAFQAEVGAGIARAPTDTRDAHQLMVLADEAAQRAGKTDTDAVRWANHSAMAGQRQQLALEGDLRRAVSEGELAVVYQPIVDLSSDQVVGAEALVRWPQPERQTPIGPNEFIPLAEELGLMDRLGIQVFEQACRQLRHWQQRLGSEALWMSVNVAPVQLRDPNLAARFSAITQAEGVSPACMKLEITESALAHGLDEVSGVIDALASAGFSLALDDFGTGYSSLGRLIELPFNVLKVDRSFVWQTPDGRGAGVVASLSQLSSHLQLYALGEGVETAAHEAFLRDCSYRYAQGYYYAKPMAAAEFETWSGWLAQ
jgi:PAS domain S-box-containing protein